MCAYTYPTPPPILPPYTYTSTLFSPRNNSRILGEMAHDNSEDRNAAVIIHKHKHRHRHEHHHTHHYYLHFDPSLLPQARSEMTRIPMILPLFEPRPPDEDRGIETGRKKALCIGINYIGQDKLLRGCVNDARRVRKFLINYRGYSSENIIILTDCGTASGRPTRKNILKGMRWLVKDARRGDSFFFHYSGHGGQTRDLDGDESDGLDEVIYPVDYQENGHIVDDDMHAIMVKSLPPGCSLTALFDSCHSGTALDLPYLYTSTGRLKKNRLRKRQLAKRSTANVVSWSSCQDGETSKDTSSVDGSAVGAMSNAFITILQQTPTISYKDLLRHLKAQLQSRYNQKPQLSSSHPVNTSDLLVI
ncbi:hypothetical protein APHAL10511_000347 [Amanita phalloides]|nr:hypothetical protein APHAL10511_000347 [Amanita phalloides]